MPGYPKALQDQNKGSGWTRGPISLSPSGWEEPSPPSIRRKMEIDDGKSAWGDPSHYNNTINLWDKNSAPAQQQSSGRQPGTASKNSAFVCTNPPKVLLKRGQPLKTPNQQPQQQSQTQQQMPGYPKALQDQNKGSGWTRGPISLSPSGWEEPSPPSIRRKMEIDDGKSAWGDPSHYNNKYINLWDKNSAPAQQQSSGRQPGTASKNSAFVCTNPPKVLLKRGQPLKTPNQQPQQQSQTQQQMPGYPKALQDQNKGSGWTRGPISLSPSGWEEPSPPSIRRKMEIDDGKSAWGDPSHYNNTINLWDKNSAPAQQQSSGRQPGTASKNSDRRLHPEDDLSAARPPADLSPRPDAGQRSDSLQ